LSLRALAERLVHREETTSARHVFALMKHLLLTMLLATAAFGLVVDSPMLQLRHADVGRLSATMGPPLPPVQCGSGLSEATLRAPPVQIELFLDLVCPFSGRMFFAVQEALPKIDERVSVVVHQVVQPWHPAGTMVHEAALAVKRVAPAAYTAYVAEVCAAFAGGSFTDEATWGLSRAQIYQQLVALLANDAALASVDAGAVAALLGQTEDGGAIRGNSGNAMTQEIKWACKYHRTRGVHVTPTVYVNGLEAGMVSSGWSAEQWCAFLEPMGADKFTGSLLQ